jgi:hypothetical protein
MNSNLTTTGAALALSAVSGNFFLGLGTGKNSNGLIGEPSGSGYNRVAVNMVATGNSANNTAQVTIPATSIVFSGLTHAGLFSQATGNNCIWVGILENSVNLGPQSPVIFEAGGLPIEISITA